MDKAEEGKRLAAAQAVALAESDMVLGLGSGSTAAIAVELLAEEIKQGRLTGVVGVPTSTQTEELARSLDVPLSDLSVHPQVDLTLDGADEVDPDMNLIKGGGGALLREKIVAQASGRLVIMVDDGKLSRRLGEKWAVPVEVVPFGWQATALKLEQLGAGVQPRPRDGGGLFRTDQGNLILDCRFGPMDDPAEVAQGLASIAGVVEHGLFLGMAYDVIVGSEQGVRRLGGKG